MKSRTETITDVLRARVLDGTLAPGARLVELQLADEYSASRASVRAAIGELAMEGLVDRAANRGATVRRVALSEAIRITEVRGLLEGLVARRAAETATPAERRELSGIVDAMKSAVGEDRLADYSDLNSVLHRRLREISRHEIAAELIGNLRNRAAHHEFRLALVPGRADESLPQHAAIVDAVVAGDPDRAERAMRFHLDSVLHVLQRSSRFERAPAGPS